MKPSGRKPTWTDAQMSAALAAYQAGTVSVRDAKRRFGIPPTSLLRYCREQDIPIRPSGCVGMMGAAHPTWGGGFRLDKDGYVSTYAPDHLWPRRSGYVRENVRVMELHLERRLTPEEVVHHKDEDRRNNALDNLEVKTKGEHSRHHRKKDIHRRKRNYHGQFC